MCSQLSLLIRRLTTESIKTKINVKKYFPKWTAPWPPWARWGLLLSNPHPTEIKTKHHMKVNHKTCPIPFIDLRCLYRFFFSKIASLKQLPIQIFNNVQFKQWRQFLIWKQPEQELCLWRKETPDLLETWHRAMVGVLEMRNPWSKGLPLCSYCWPKELRSVLFLKLLWIWLLPLIFLAVILSEIKSYRQKVALTEGWGFLCMREKREYLFSSSLKVLGIAGLRKKHSHSHTRRNASLRTVLVICLHFYAQLYSKEPSQPLNLLSNESGNLKSKLS